MREVELQEKSEDYRNFDGNKSISKLRRKGEKNSKQTKEYT